MRTYNIAMVSDYFYPQPGGVESHIYQLSSKLIDRGHKVVIIVHASKNRTGVRYLTNGIKVYHVPFFVLYRETTFPTVFSFFPLFRNIIIRENIEIVHGHGSLSNLCHEAIFHARTMGLRTVFTDHSLFGFAGAGNIFTNKLLKFTLSDVDHVICVSHTCKENTVLRASLDPRLVSVIPNAVVAENFRPLNYPQSTSVNRKPPRRTIGPDDIITIVVISRLFYNKGIDLLIAAIPKILADNPKVRFIVAGSGPKAIDIEQMIERNVLQDRVEMLGSIRHDEVRGVMVRGHIYLHPALTEAFGTVLVEAASCGLYVVTTRVGGIPEVLPPHMTSFARPEEEDLVAAANAAIADLRANRIRTEEFHDEVRKMYSWEDVANRTERVYRGITGHIPHQDFYFVDSCASSCCDGILTSPDTSDMVGAETTKHCGRRQNYFDNDIHHGFSLADRLKRYYGCGVWAGKLFCVCAIVDYLIWIFLELVAPRWKIDVCKDWPRKKPVLSENEDHEKLNVLEVRENDKSELPRRGSLSDNESG